MNYFRSRVLPVLLCCLFVLGAAAAVNAAELVWKIKAHSLDFQILKQEVTAIVDPEQGFVPVGMSVTGEELYLLYVKSPLLQLERWTISRYYTLEELTEGISEKMRNGYIPMGYASFNGTHYLLYIMTEHSGSAWRLVPTDLDAESVRETIQALTAQAYVPMAINADQGQYQILLVQLAEGALDNWQIGSFEASGTAIRDGVNRIVAQGYLPWGIFVGNERVNILFVQPKGGLDASSILTGGEPGVGLPETGVGQDLDAVEPAPGESPEPAQPDASDISEPPAGESPPDAAPADDQPVSQDQDPVIGWEGVEPAMQQDILDADLYWRGGEGMVCGPFSTLVNALPPESWISISRVSSTGSTLLSLQIVPPPGLFKAGDNAGFVLDMGYVADSELFRETLRLNNERNWQQATPALKLDIFGGEMTWDHPDNYRAMTESDHGMLLHWLSIDRGWGALSCR